MAQLKFEKLHADAIIIGFTGALGSGCSYLSEGLSKFHEYKCVNLSKYIHEECKKRQLPETIENLQNIGNELRLTNGNDYFARVALSEIDIKLPKEQQDIKAKIAIDGIRNIEEADLLKQFPNFFLISVQAERTIRSKRMIDDNKCQSEDNFLKADERDADEGKPNGQQVLRCNDASDIIVINEGFINKVNDNLYRSYISDKLYTKYISQIEALAEGKRFRQLPDIDQALMTVAYVESRRSSCLKRKVGAVIASIPIDGKKISAGNIFSSGFNDVPIGEPSCLDHQIYKGCARDYLIENLGKSINNCPNCGEKINIKAECKECKSEITQFKRKCPQCNGTISIQYICPQCKKDIFREYLPGGNPNIGKMLDMCRSLHAEENAILNLCLHGVPGHDKKMVLYTTTYPCNLCANKILKVGIKEVVYAEPYETKETKELFENNKDKVTVRRFEGIKSTAYFRFFSLGEQRGGEGDEKRGKASPS